MKISELVIGTLAYATATLAQAEPGIALGSILGTTALPILEGGLLTVAVAALVAGIHVVRGKQKP